MSVIVQQSHALLNEKQMKLLKLHLHQVRTMCILVSTMFPPYETSKEPAVVNERLAMVPFTDVFRYSSYMTSC